MGGETCCLKCLFCVSTWKNLIASLVGHLMDLCPEFHLQMKDVCLIVCLDDSIDPFVLYRGHRL